MIEGSAEGDSDPQKGGEPSVFFFSSHSPSIRIWNGAEYSLTAPVPYARNTDNRVILFPALRDPREQRAGRLLLLRIFGREV